MEKLHIAIDGPAGAGKSTIAKIIAERLRITYIDTGAMYRALTLKFLNKSCEFENEELLVLIAKETIIELDYDKVFLDGQDVSEEIRDPLVSKNVSKVARIAEIRNRMVELQQKIAQNKSIIMDGRDIGTQVLPNTKYKFFLTASIDERAHRRFMELKEKGFLMSLEEIYDEIKQRDKMDIERTASPLRPAKDAVIIDTTSKSIEAVIYEIIDIIDKGE